MPKDGQTLLVICFYMLVVVALTWPLLTHLNGYILPAGVTNISWSDFPFVFEGVNESRESLLNGTILSVHELPGDFSPIFEYFVILLSWCGFSNAAAYNLFFVLSVVLSAFFMYLLMYKLSRDRVASLFCGVVYISVNYLLEEYTFGHPTRMQIQWIPLVFYALERMIRSGGFRNAVLLGAALTLQIYASTQHLVYLTFVAPLYLLFRHIFVDRKRLLRRQFWKGSAIACAVFIAASGYYIFKRFELGYGIRTVEENLVPWCTMTSLSQLVGKASAVSLGIVPAVCLVVGMAVFLLGRNRKKYAPYIPYALVFVILLAFLVGPSTWYAPYFWLYKWWPLVNRFRCVSTLFPFVLMSASILSSLPLLWAKECRAIRKYRVLLVIILVVAVVGCHIFSSGWFVGRHIFYP
jgi:hypothetical protein